MAPVRVVPSRLDAALHAELSGPTSLHYTAGIPADADIPVYVRSASAIRRWAQRLAIVQDDVLALAMLDLHDGGIEPLLLPSQDGLRTFDVIRGNKQAKPDLEAAVVLPDGRLVLFGSGASALRERLVVVSPDRKASPAQKMSPTLRTNPARQASPGGRSRVIVASDWYGHLHAEPAFCRTGLNIESALISGGRLVLFQRANGPSSAPVPSVNAAGEVSLDAFVAWLDGRGLAPSLLTVRQYDLGSVGGVLVGITDACALPDGRICFVACAEDSPDAIADGPVVASRFGIIDRDDVRMTDIISPDGHRTLLKLEGIEPRPGEPLAFDVVADVDDPGAAALLAKLVVKG